MYKDKTNKILTLGIAWWAAENLVFILLFLLSFEGHLFYHVRHADIRLIVESITAPFTFPWKYF